MPWDFRVIEYRPCYSVSKLRLQQWDQLIQENKACFWGADWVESTECPALWNLFPDEFISVEKWLYLETYLLELTDFPCEITLMISNYAKDPMHFPEIISPPSVSLFLNEVITSKSRRISLNTEEQELCMVRIMPHDLLSYAKFYGPLYEKEFLEKHYEFSTLPSPQDMYRLWKENAEHPEFEDSLQRVLFCYQCYWLSIHQFSVICSH